MPIFRALYKGLFDKTSGAEVLIKYSETANFLYESVSWRVIFLSAPLRTVGEKGGEKVWGNWCSGVPSFLCPWRWLIRFMAHWADQSFSLRIPSDNEGARGKRGCSLRFIFIKFIYF